MSLKLFYLIINVSTIQFKMIYMAHIYFNWTVLSLCYENNENKNITNTVCVYIYITNTRRGI